MGRRNETRSATNDLELQYPNSFFTQSIWIEAHAKGKEVGGLHLESVLSKLDQWSTKLKKARADSESEDQRMEILRSISDDVSELARAITHISNLDNSTYKVLRRNARQRVEKHFDLSRMVNAYESLYRDISQ